MCWIGVSLCVVVSRRHVSASELKCDCGVSRSKLEQPHVIGEVARLHTLHKLKAEPVGRVDEFFDTFCALVLAYVSTR